jgi:chromate reductase, NAD(P)H dehydrogenase (quinone)
MKIIAFGASYSKNSINKVFATYAAGFFKPAEIEVLDLNNYPLPVFTVDLEEEQGYSDLVIKFVNKLAEANLLIISLAEHNGSYTAGFKNLFDWSSRYKNKMFESCKVLLLSTSTGSRGGLGVMEAAMNRFPRHGAEIIGTFSLPYFDKNFNVIEGFVDVELATKFQNIIKSIQEAF